MSNTLLTKPVYQRTVDAKPNDVSIVKPGELVDVVEMSPLRLIDRRIYNLLIANAWDSITVPTQHAIRKAELQNTLHKGTDRLEDSIRRLMAAIVQVRVSNNGKWETKSVQLLGGNVVPDADDGMVRYDFHPIMLEIIAESRVFARLHRQIMFALTSKYSLALYEMVQKRGNMNKTAENFTIEEIRGFLGVPKGKLSSWINLRNKAIDPAVKEVSALSDFEIEYTAIKSTVKGSTKQIAAIRLTWTRKAVAELKDVERELNASKIGRKARLSGSVEQVTLGVVEGNCGLNLRPDTLEKAKKMLKGYDIYAVEDEWRRWARTKGEPPQSPDGAFINFCKTYAKNNPLYG